MKISKGLLKTNQTRLVRMAVCGKPAHPLRFSPFEIDAEGRAHALPSVGGISYNIKLGDPVFGWKGDHLEPGVSVVLDEEKRSSRQNMALQYLACVGNQARILSGAAKGATGTVIGHHGGVEHLLLDFDDKTLKKMTYDDKILIEAFGQGLEIDGMPGVACFNLDPRMIALWRIKKIKNTLEVPVVMTVPSAIMGSGIGHPDPGTGDYDITTQDPKTVRRLGLDKLCFGDLVAISDADHTFGRHYYEGAVTIGIVVHSDSVISGHGPGVCTLLSSKTGVLKPVPSSKANLGRLMNIGRFRRR